MPVPSSCPSIDTRGLIPNSFEFTLLRCPQLSFFVTSVMLPSVRLEPLVQETPLGTIEVPSDRMKFDPFELEFLVDERMENWLEIFRWMQGLGFPEEYPQYTSENQRMEALVGLPPEAELPKNYSDATLIINASNNVPIRKITFVDCFPISLTPIRLTSQANSAELVRATVVFEYTYFTVE